MTHMVNVKGPFHVLVAGLIAYVKTMLHWFWPRITAYGQ